MQTFNKQRIGPLLSAAEYPSDPALAKAKSKGRAVDDPWRYADPDRSSLSDRVYAVGKQVVEELAHLAWIGKHRSAVMVTEHAKLDALSFSRGSYSATRSLRTSAMPTTVLEFGSR
jgi:hypothetical protein